MLKRAIEIAHAAHRGQIEKNGAPYIEHPLRLLSMAENMGNVPVTLKVIAVLHDVVEDSEYTLDQLAQEFPNDVVEGVDAVTRREDETYFEFIVRAKEHPLGWIVKTWDVLDHLRPGHEAYLQESLIKRYRKALKILLE
jgi:(p)ppGpp synthase/HD superfamily hydrolase